MNIELSESERVLLQVLLLAARRNLETGLYTKFTPQEVMEKRVATMKTIQLLELKLK